MSTQPSDPGQWFAEEVRPFEPSLRAYLRRSLPSEADVEDLLQESYVRLLKAREKGTVRETKPFLFAIARNAVRTFIQRKTGAERIPITEEAALAVLEDDKGVVEFVCRTQELTLLAEAINALPPRCREVILLRKIQGHSQKEIAALLGIAEHTVESLAVKGVGRIERYLRDHGVGPDSDHG
ncbi:MAG TPA: sigma-70 family RNA polymerase sigma factor [Opitutaceae bacterium]|nr:sigma-70 family RNA polymerase sigma factor [Opitutaceae bacterium]